MAAPMILVEENATEKNLGSFVELVKANYAGKAPAIQRTNDRFL